ncbi:DUF1194 domain-containing protein [Primorskyibacter flagellatus]|uniref:DUF1194 domain-containing protein n=1 Tax=Primorskyibacter flagellatus TaxID=1387277 RepID=UPI003A945941
MSDLRRIIRGLAVGLTLILTVTAAQAACRQALVLGLDVSGSVDATEYALQMQGLANALMHAEVQAALLAMPSEPVRLSVFEWSGPTSHRLTLPWTEIENAASIAAAATALRRATRPAGDPSTAIGAAMSHGAALLAGQSDCRKRTLDLSGDGKSNTGPHPREIDGAALGGITVNGLVIGPPADLDLGELAELSSYYQAYVLRGPDAFVETARGFADFEAAMVRKLKRELQGLVMSANTP